MWANSLKTPALGAATTAALALLSVLLARAASVMTLAVLASAEKGRKPSSGGSGFREETRGGTDAWPGL